MNEQEFFQKTFSKLHASDRTLQTVISRARSGKGSVGVSKRLVVLVTVLVMLFSMALVAHATGLLADLVAILTPAKDPAQIIDHAFGNHISIEKPQREDAYGNPIDSPSMDRPEPNLTETEKLIGAYISDVDGVVSVGENTFTLKSFMIDETGTGDITWTLENPNGIAYADAGFGMVYFNSRTIDNPNMIHHGPDGSKKDVLDMATALIARDEAGTKLELVSYFGTVAKYEIGDTLIWAVSTNRKQETRKIQITPVSHIPAHSMATPEGMKLNIAPQGITFDIDSNEEFLTDRIVIHFQDGTQYCVEDDEAMLYNLSEAYWRQSDEFRYDDLVYLFNRLIDPEEVSSVEVTGGFLRLEPMGDYYEPVCHRQNYVFYP